MKRSPKLHPRFEKECERLNLIGGTVIVVSKVWWFNFLKELDERNSRKDQS